MALARWQATIVDDAGNVLSGAQVTVRKEIAGAPLASLFSDRAGSTPTGNPVTADSEGYASFHVAGGAYRITAASGAFSREWRYVGVGMASETDGVGVGVGLAFDTGVNDADPGAGNVRFNNSTPSLATSMFVDNASVDGVTITTWLDTFDDGGSSTNRGVVQLMNASASGFMLARVTGSVVDGTGYRKISITPLATAGSFTAAERVFLSFGGRGVDGGDVVGPAGSTSGNLPQFADTTGKLLSDSGKSIVTLGTGKQTLWIPASAMTPRVTNGAAVGSLDSGSNDLTFLTLDFDQTTAEFAHFTIAMPKQWNEGTVTFQPFWTATAGTATQTAILSLAGVAISDDDVMNATFGTAVTSNDALIATTDLHVGPESAAVTIGGTPAENDLCVFQVARDISDTLAADLRLLGIKLFITTNANTDA